METWQKLSLILAIPLLITIFLVRREIKRVIGGSSKPLRKRKRRHH